jgi:RNA polymerase sigma-70 factor (ECF subfamily)
MGSVQPSVNQTMTLTTPVGGSPAIDLESSLARRAASGDSTAFEGLYHRHVARIHSLVRRMATAEVADELTQDVFVRAWDKLATFRGESAFGTWLYRLAINVVLTQRRRDRTERDWLLPDDDQLAALGTRRASPGVALDLESAIARLPEGARQVFVLHDVEGWTHEEIAERLGLVAGTSKSQLSRARAALRRMLDGY